VASSWDEYIQRRRQDARGQAALADVVTIVLHRSWSIGFDRDQIQQAVGRVERKAQPKQAWDHLAHVVHERDGASMSRPSLMAWVT
jgi:hypothetical protein